MKKLFSSFLLLALCLTAVASEINSEFYVRGHVVDKASKAHIPYATAIIVGTTRGVSADADGHFILDRLPVGEHEIKVSMSGYSSAIHKIKVGTAPQSRSLTFELEFDAMMVDQVVVSANRTEVKRKESPSIVSVLTSDMFNVVSAPTLADGLAYQPGVRVDNNCQNCGFTQVRINGLDGHYSQIMVDSRPIFSALAGVYGLEQIPANMIDRVEVVRGGGSALFGSSAIGGTINIITKTPTENSAELATNLSIIGEDGTMDMNTTANASVISDNNRAGLTIYGQTRDRSAYDANNDGFSEIAELETQTLGLRSFFKMSDYSRLSLQYDATRDYRRGGDELDKPFGTTEIAESVSHSINAGGVSWDLYARNYSRKFNLYSSAQHIERKSFYGGFNDVAAGVDPSTGHGFTRDMTIVSGAQLTQNWDHVLFMPSEFVAGVEHNYNDLYDISFGVRPTPIGQSVNTYSAYAQNEWRNERFGILLGARLDKHSLLDDAVLSPRVNLRYNPSANVNFRASYSTGFRAPQLFDEDLHITIVGGDPTIQEDAPNLKQENSQSFTVSADLYKQFNKLSTNLLVEAFYTKIDDAFALQVNEARSAELGLNVMERYNSSGQSVKGLTVEARATLPRVAELQAGITYKKSEFEELEYWAGDERADLATKRTFRTPDFYGYLTASAPLSPSFELSTSATYTGEMLVPNEEKLTLTETKDFFDMNIKLDYTVSLVQATNLTLSAGVQNIFDSYQDDFDEGASRDAGYMYGPMLPRRFTLSAKLKF